MVATERLLLRHDLPPGGGDLGGLARLDMAPLRETLGASTIIVASDVDNPLLGPIGAAAVFGRQKGAGPHDVEALERSLRQDRKSTRLHSSHWITSRMPSSA